jgi:hypothetical protein
MKFLLIIKVICGIASEAKFDIFNDRNERIFQAFESKRICFFILIKKLYVYI